MPLGGVDLVREHSFLSRLAKSPSLGRVPRHWGCSLDLMLALESPSQPESKWAVSEPMVKQISHSDLSHSK